MAISQQGKVEIVVRFQGEEQVSPAAAQVNRVIKALAAHHESQVGGAASVVDRLQGAWSEATGAVESFTTRLGFVKQGVDAAIALASGLADVVSEGAAAADQYDVLTKNISGFENIVATAKKTTKGAFSQAEIVSAIGTFDAFGISLQGIDDVMAQVAKTAVRTGEDTGHLLSSLTTGIARLSPAILDNLQLQTSLSEINERAAETTGKATKELTKQEQQVAALNIVLEQLAKKNASVALDQSRTTSIKRLSNAWDDLKTSVGGFLADGAVGIIDFFDDLFTGPSEAEAEIMRLADTFPQVMSGMRSSAEQDLGAVLNLFNKLQSEANETQRLFSAVDERAGEQDELAKRLTESQGIAQLDFERKQRRVQNLVKQGLLTAQQAHERERDFENERNDRITIRSSKIRAAFAREISQRRVAEAVINGIESGIADKERELTEDRTARAFSFAQLQKANLEEVEGLEKQFASAKARRDSSEARRIADKIIAAKTYQNELENAAQAERSGGGRKGTSRRPDGTNIPTPDRPRPPRLSPKLARATDEDPLADLEARLQNAEELTRATVDGLRDYQISVAAIFRDFPQMDDDQRRRLNDRWQASQQRILDAEHRLSVTRQQVAFETERRITEKQKEEEEKRLKMAEERQEKQLEFASGMIGIAAQLGQTFIKGEKERAAFMVAIAVADGLLALARGDYVGAAAGAAAAISYGVQAGRGGGGTRGLQESRQQQVSESSLTRSSNAPYVINMNAPWYGTPGELAAHLRGVQRVGSGSGIATGAAV